MSPIARLPPPVSPFIGRECELERIDQLSATAPLYLVYGPAGIGKTELVCATHARSFAQLRSLYVRPDDGGVLTALSSALAVEPSEAAIIDALESDEWFVVLDSAHEAPLAEVAHLAGLVARHVRRSRVFICSRQWIPLPAAAADAATLVLRELSAEASQALVEVLAKRSAKSASTPYHCGGNPRAIRDAFGAASNPTRLVEELTCDLGKDALETLQLLAVAGDPIPAQDLATALAHDHDRAAAARDQLACRFLVHEQEGAVHAPDFVRAALETEMPRDSADCARARMVAVYRARFEQDRRGHVTDAIAAARALCRGKDSAAAMELVISAADPILAAGMEPELLGVIESVKREGSTSAALVALHARTLARVGEPLSAYHVLHELHQRTDLGHTLQQRTRARVDARMGLLSDALARLPVTDETEPTPLEHIELLAMRGDLEQVQTLGGQRDDARTAVAMAHFANERYEACEQLAELGMADSACVTDDCGLGLLALLVLSRVYQHKLSAATEAWHQHRRAAGGQVASSAHVLVEGTLALAHGNDDAALENIRAAHAAACRQRDALMESLLGLLLAEFLTARGEPEQAADILTSASARASASEAPWLSLRCKAELSWALVNGGDIDRGGAIARALLTAPNTGSYSRARAARAQAYGYVVAGDPAAARGALAHEPNPPPAVAAQLDLARTELESHGGDPAVGLQAGRRARHHFSSAGLRWEEASVSIALAACHLQQPGEGARVCAERELDRARHIADQHGLVPIQLRAAVIEAAIASFAGDVARSRSLLAHALRRARTVGGRHPEVQIIRCALDGSLARDATFPGLQSLVAALGLSGARRIQVVGPAARRIGTTVDLARECGSHDIVIDTRDAKLITGDGDAFPLRPIVGSLLGRIVEAGPAGVDADSLYCDVWGALEYHPLRHRNKLHVTLNHARRALAEVFPDRPVIERIATGWRIAQDLDACAVREVQGQTDAAPRLD